MCPRSLSSCKIRRGGKKLVMKNPRIEVTTGLSPDELESMVDIEVRESLEQVLAAYGAAESALAEYTDVFQTQLGLVSDTFDLESRLLLPKRFAKQCAATYAQSPNQPSVAYFAHHHLQTWQNIDQAFVTLQESFVAAVPRYAKTKSTGVEKLIYDIETPEALGSAGGLIYDCASCWDVQLGSSARGCNLYFATPCQTDAQP